MSIKIEITDPTLKDEKMLVSLARFLMECAGHQMVAAPPEMQPTIKENQASSFAGTISPKEEIGRGERSDLCWVDNDVVKDWKKEKKIKKPKKDNPISAAIAIDEKIKKEIIEVEDKEGNQYEISKTNPLQRAIKDQEYKIIEEKEEPLIVNFNTVMTRLADAVRDKKLTQAQVVEMTRKHGLSKTYDLAFDGNAHIVQKINDELNQMGV